MLKHELTTTDKQSMQKQIVDSKSRREIRKQNRSPRNRLLSIQYDVEQFCLPIMQQWSHLCDIPIITNERCGNWYAYPLMKDNPISCCFKSTDGHFGTWNFSFKRLNLNIIRILSTHGACIILDASASKFMPDSFSRTIPIWAAVMNRIAIRYRKLYDVAPCEHDQVDDHDSLHTPEDVVTKEEHDMIQNMIDAKVEALYQSRSIVDPLWLATSLLKPIRPYWITPQSVTTIPLLDKIKSEKYYSIICINCSDYQKSQRLTKANDTQDDKSFIYIPGAADDDESWARNLTPHLFWENSQTILDSEFLSSESFNALIDSIVQQEMQNNDEYEKNVVSIDSEHREHNFDRIGNLNLFIGTRRAGRPPACWTHFGAILNVTDTEYPEIIESTPQQSTAFQPKSTNSNKSHYYLQLPVREGKRDRTELEHWMALGIVFIVVHARQNYKVLIHCAQGMDRSVALVIAAAAIFCDYKYPLQWNDYFWRFPIDEFVQESPYNASGLSSDALKSMLGQGGRVKLFALVWPEDSKGCITKESIRIVLQLVQQYREKANPSRSTMQKLHRFFMS
jgi:tRNA A64-2'-O-ribosylphosphate transferase